MLHTVFVYDPTPPCADRMSAVPEATTTTATSPETGAAASVPEAKGPEETKDQVPLVEEITPADPKKHAFVTLVMLGDDYVPGALVLAANIRQKGSKASLVVMVTADVSQRCRDFLRQLYDEVIEVPLIDADVPSNMKKGTKAKSRNWVSKIFTRLYALKLTQYEKVVLLDADLYCAKNPDSIFALQAPAAICAHFTLEQAEEVKGQLYGRKGIDLAKQRFGIRGSCILLTPSAEDYERAMDMITHKPKQVPTIKQVQQTATGAVTKARSKFSLFQDGDDDEDAPEKNINESQRAAIEAKSQDINILSGVLDTTNVLNSATVTEADLNSMATVRTYSYGDPKAQMGPDEYLFLNLYRDTLTYLHPRYSHSSWKNEAGPYGSVFLHFQSELPWNRTQDWDDYANWDKAALELIASENMGNVRTYLLDRVPILAAKERGETIKFSTPHHGRKAHKANKPKDKGQGKDQSKDTKKDTTSVAAPPVAAAAAAAAAKPAAAESAPATTEGSTPKPTPAAAPAPPKPVWGTQSAAALLAKGNPKAAAAVNQAKPAAAAASSSAAPAPTAGTAKPAWGNRNAVVASAAGGAAAQAANDPKFPALGK